MNLNWPILTILRTRILNWLMLFDLVYFYNIYVSSYCSVQMGKILDNEEINSYYKGLPVFGNLTDLRLYWTCGICEIHDWDEVMKMLHNCPKLQALKIKKVCLLHQWIVTSFYLFFSFLHVYFTNPILPRIDSRQVQPKRIGNIHIMFLNVLRLVLQHVELKTMKLPKLIFDSQHTFWWMQDFYRLWPFAVPFT
jgi:hypothetical protein